MATISLALSAGCAIDPAATAVTEQATEHATEHAIVAVDLGCALDLPAGDYVECLRSAYAMRCASGELPDGISCLGSQRLNDLSNDDILAELGLLCDPLPQPVQGACWQDAAADFGCALDLDAVAHAECIRAVYVARCALGALPGGLWCLGNEWLNDLSNDDLIAELGLLEPSPVPVPQPVPVPVPVE